MRSRAGTQSFEPEVRRFHRALASVAASGRERARAGDRQESGMKRDLDFAIGSGPVDVRSRWMAAWAIALTAIGLLTVYWPTAASIVEIWIRSETFAHGFVVLPVALWLAWRRRGALATIPIKPWWPGLAFVLASGALWFVASASGARVVA